MAQRAVCLNCMDGRVQLPIIQWIKDNHDVDYVDMITEPGIDGLLADDTIDIDLIKYKINISIEKNNASVIFVAGHYDCKGNPGSDQEHKEQVLSGVERIAEAFGEKTVIGLWINSGWKVEKLI